MRVITKVFASIFCLVPALTLAQQVNLTLANTGLGNDYDLSYKGSTEDAFVGQLLFQVNKSSTIIPTYCVDLDDFIGVGSSYNTSVIQTSTLPNGNGYKLAGDILSAGVATATDNDHAAALQIAIWTAVYGNQFSLSGVSTAVQNDEQAYYNAGLATKANAIYFNAAGTGGQSQITTTPEPCGLATLGLGAIGLFFRRKRQA